MPLKVAYLTTAYPEVAHTFIRREIVELERRGNHVLRMALRKGKLVERRDNEELSKVRFILEQNKLNLVKSVAKVVRKEPFKFVDALKTTLEMSKQSERGLVRHIAYLVEACDLKATLEDEGVEHVHVHFGTNCATVARLAHKMGGPTYSMTVHGPTEFDAAIGFSLGKKIEDSLFTVAITNYCSAQLRRWVDYDQWDKIKIVHCTVGDHILAEPEPIPEASRKLVCVGRLTPQKGQLLLVDAMGRLVKEGVDIHLVLAGDGPMREVLEARVAALGLKDNVTITGWIGEEEVRRHLSESRALVLPSFAEGLPVVIMEAFAAARPVITTSIAGIPELVHPGENGWLCISGDIDDLVRAMRECIEAPISRLNEMGQDGRRRVLEGHTASTEAAKMEQLFAEAGVG